MKNKLTQTKTTECERLVPLDQITETKFTRAKISVNGWTFISRLVLAFQNYGQGRLTFCFSLKIWRTKSYSLVPTEISCHKEYSCHVKGYGQGCLKRFVKVGKTPRSRSQVQRGW
jgi:hypothetical protein